MKPNVLLIDNYDSFTYNIYQAIIDLGGECEVHKNDDIPFNALSAFDGIIISPGPGLPEESGDLQKLLKHLPNTLPVLGICLGMQAIAQHFGGTLKQLNHVMHGVQTPILKQGESQLFKQVAFPFQAGRYHSWIVDPNNPGSGLHLTAIDQNGVPMALEHEQLPVLGVQFHPESILTPEGKRILNNFLLLLRKDPHPVLPTINHKQFGNPKLNGLYC